MLISKFYPLIRALLFRFDPEVAHEIGLKGADLIGYLSAVRGSVFPCASMVSRRKKILGLEFPNPIGLAAGFDKEGAHVSGISALGFGFVEVGTVTPKPQPGNDRPRLFRIPTARVVINRMGFNNHGVDALVANLKKAKFQGIVGVNIGKNKVTPEDQAAVDYLYCLDRVWEVASYVVINVSSPNTPGLRNLQTADILMGLLSKVKQRQAELTSATKKYVPVLVKISPDLSDSQIEDIARVVNETGIDGVIATNSTLDHSSVRDEVHGTEQGGLTGAPLFPLSLRVVSSLRKALNPNVPIIGCGGVMNEEQALEMFHAGADLIQIYTGLIYNGPAFVARLVRCA